eukprot:1249901-Prymnesium_polylepis.1
MNVRVKCFRTASAASCVFSPMNPNWRDLPALVRSTLTSVISWPTDSKCWRSRCSVQCLGSDLTIRRVLMAALKERTGRQLARRWTWPPNLPSVHVTGARTPTHARIQAHQPPTE